MTMQDIVDEIKLELTGSVLELEIEDATIEQVIKKALREIERYWDETKLITVPFASCIDLTGFDHIAVKNVYRAEGVGENTGSTGMLDPLYAQQWMMFSGGGNIYNLNNYLLNYGAYSTLLRIKNTISTDLSFKEDKLTNKLYINQYNDTPSRITIEYIPHLHNVEEIKTENWIDVLIRLSLALTKITLGRIRTRYTQSGALWSQDGETLLSEGNTELKEIRDKLTQNDNLICQLD